MKPLAIHQKMMMWMFISSAPKATSKLKTVLYAAFYCTVLLSQIFAVASSLLYFFKLMSINIEQALYTTFQMTCCASAAYVFLLAGISRRRINMVFEHLEDICDASKDNDSFGLLMDVDNQNASILTWFYKIEQTTYFVVIVVLSAVSVLFQWIFTHNFDATDLYHPYALIFPWDQLTAFGYIVEICVSYVLCTGYYLSYGSILLLFIAMCLFHRTFSQMFQHSLRKLDIPDISRNNEEFLVKLIQFQASTVQWFKETVEVYRSFVLIQLMCNMIQIACSVFQLDLKLKHIDATLGMLCFALFGCISNLFVYCYFGIMATESHLNMSGYLYESNWLNLPARLQKYLVLMIGNMSQPIYYHGFNIAILDLETFSKMVKSGFTYYMILKTVTSS